MTWFAVGEGGWGCSMANAGKIAWNARAGAAVNARRRLPLLVSAYFAQVRTILDGDPPPAQLHLVRLASKRLRYTLELFRPCYGPGLNLRLAALQRLQQLLGEVNDCAATERLLAEAIPPSTRRDRFQHFLHRRAAAKAVAFRREWRHGFDAPGRERWWLTYLATQARD